MPHTPLEREHALHALSVLSSTSDIATLSPPTFHSFRRHCPEVYMDKDLGEY